MLVLAPWKGPGRSAVAAAVLVAVLSATSQAAVVATGGFEAPTFHTGPLLGQQGWLSSGVSGSTADVVQTPLADTGSQAVAVTRQGGSDKRWAMPVSGQPSTRFVSVRWRMRVEQPTIPSGAFGPFFGVEGYDGQGALGVLGSLGVDASTREVLVQSDQGGFFVTATPQLVNYGQWRSYELLFDFQNDRYTALLDGAVISQYGFVDGALGLDQFTDADIAAIAAGFDSASQNATGLAYFDGFVVTAGISGDFNGDGVVNAADYTVWRDTLGSSPAPGAFGGGLAADHNGDGAVDALDYALWASRYGATPPAGAAVAVPEPIAFVPALIGVAGLGRRRAG